LRDRWSKKEASLAEYAGDNDGTVERTTYNGGSIVYVADHEAAAAVGDFAVIADRPQDLYPVIEVHAGDAKLRADLPATALAFAFVDGEALRVPLQQAMIDDTSLAPFVGAVLPQANHRFGAALSVNAAGVQLDLPVDEDGSVDTGQLDPGQEGRHTFDRAGTSCRPVPPVPSPTRLRSEYVVDLGDFMDGGR